MEVVWNGFLTVIGIAAGIGTLWLAWKVVWFIHFCYTYHKE